MVVRVVRWGVLHIVNHDLLPFFSLKRVQKRLNNWEKLCHILLYLSVLTTDTSGDWPYSETCIEPAVYKAPRQRKTALTLMLSNWIFVYLFMFYKYYVALKPLGILKIPCFPSLCFNLENLRKTIWYWVSTRGMDRAKLSQQMLAQIDFLVSHQWHVT